MLHKSSTESKIGHESPDPSPLPPSTILIFLLLCGGNSGHSQMPRICSFCHQEINFTGKRAQLVSDCKAFWKWKTKYSVSARCCYYSEGKRPSAEQSLWLFGPGIQKNLGRKEGGAIGDMVEQQEDASLRKFNIFCEARDPEIITGSFDYINRLVAFWFLNICREEQQWWTFRNCFFSQFTVQIRNMLLSREMQWSLK